MTYRLHPEAALEHERQVAYYEERSSGLGRRYHAATMQAIGKAVEVPHRYKVVRPPDLRKVRIGWNGAGAGRCASPAASELLGDAGLTRRRSTDVNQKAHACGSSAWCVLGQVGECLLCSATNFC